MIWIPRAKWRQSDSCVAHTQRLISTTSCHAASGAWDASRRWNPPGDCEAACRSKFPSACTVQSWTLSCLASCLHRHADRQTDGQIARWDGAAFWLLGRAQTPRGTAAVCTSVFGTWRSKSDETWASWKQQPATVTLEHEHRSFSLGRFEVTESICNKLQHFLIVTIIFLLHVYSFGNVSLHVHMFYPFFSPSFEFLTLLHLFIVTLDLSDTILLYIVMQNNYLSSYDNI